MRVGGIGVDVGKGVGVRVGGWVGKGVSKTGRNGVGVDVLFGSTVMVGPWLVGKTSTGAAQLLTMQRINKKINRRLQRENFMVGSPWLVAVRKKFLDDIRQVSAGMLAQDIEEILGGGPAVGKLRSKIL
jgi:hypothetical protein